MGVAQELHEVTYTLENEILRVKDVMPNSRQLLEAAEALGAWKRPTVVDENQKQYLGTRRNNTAINIDHRRHSEMLEWEVAVGRSLHAGAHIYNQLNKHLRVTKDTGYQLLRYEPGQHFLMHVDQVQGHPQWGQRVLSAVLYLNEDYEGGELHFPRQGLKISPSAGEVVLFPSSFAFPHESCDVTRGVKYGVVTWFM